MHRAFLIFLLLAPAFAQSCPDTPVYGTCDLVFELKGNHPKPYETAEIRVEFRSPEKTTYLMPAFWDGGNRLVARVSPVMAGQWEYRITSNVGDWDNQQGQFNATASERVGFIRPANLHHWATEQRKPHLWMGDGYPEFGKAAHAAFEESISARAAAKFTHVWAPIEARLRNGVPDVDYYREFDARMRFANDKGLIVDLILPSFEPADPTERARFLRYLASRYSPFNVTWIFGVGGEERPDGRATLIAQLDAFRKADPYGHPITGASRHSSSWLTGDKKINFLTYAQIDPNIGAVEHQFFQLPAINMAAAENEDQVQRNVWNALMNGQYPAFLRASNAGEKQMTTWMDLLAGTRYWELEPYFDVDGGRACALEGVEYIVYVEKPSGPIEVIVEKHEYQVVWINPITGERIPQKDWKGDKFNAEPPSRDHDWVLHLAREGKKEGMLKSYRFDSREVPLVQEIEQNPQAVPFDILEPKSDALKVGETLPFAIKIKRESRATRSMLFLWTAEVALDGMGPRVIGTGKKGEFKVPSLAKKFPSAISIRVAAVNANGKAYVIDRVYKLVP
jgi:hypothetical protein